jgi:hypothetical protein
MSTQGELTVRADGEVVAYLWVGARAMLHRSETYSRMYGQLVYVRRVCRGGKWHTEKVLLKDRVTPDIYALCKHADRVTIRDEYRY